jgi:hypothetical protein
VAQVALLFYAARMRKTVVTSSIRCLVPSGTFTLLDLFSPHSDQLTVQERIRFTSPGILEDRLTAKTRRR